MPIKDPKSYRYVICLVIYLCYFLVYFHRLCPAVIALDMQESFQASGTLLGLLGGAYFYAYAFMQLPIGLLADSWGPRKTISTLFLIAAAGSILMGLAPTLGWALLGRVLVGLGVSAVFVCNYKLLAEWFEARQFIIMGGVFQAVGGIGALSASAPLAWTTDLIGWRWALGSMGVATLVMAVLSYVFIRNRPPEMAWSTGPAPTTIHSSGPIGLAQGIKQVITAGRFWPVSVWTFFATGVSFAMGSLWGGPFLIQVYGLSKTAAGGVLAMFSVALIAGPPVLSALANYLGRKPVLIGCSALLATVCGLLSLMTDALPILGLFAVFFCLSLSGAATGAVVATVSKELFPSSIAGTSVGMVNLFPFLGGAVFQVVMGRILTMSGQLQGLYTVAGYRNMFLCSTAGALISLGAALLIRETLNRPTE
jgi:MFS family permease